MSNTRDNGPELDYYELRRRHEEYKTRARTAQPPEEAVDAVAPERPAPVPGLGKSAQEKPVRREAPPAEEAPADVLPVEEAAGEESAAPVDPLARFVEDDDDAYYDDGEDMEADEDASANANPNPFDSFIHFFHGVKDGIARRREAKEAELEDLDDLTDEELAALEEDGEADDFELPAQDAPRSASVPQAAQPHDVEDVPEDTEAAPRRLDRRVPDADDLSDAVDGEIDDPDGEDWELDEDAGASGGGLKKFLNLFVTRVDDGEE